MKRILCFIMMLALFIPGVLVFGACKDKKEEEYNIIVTAATIPPLMSTLATVDNSIPTIMWYGRKQTFTDVSKLGFTMYADPSYVSSDRGLDPAAINEISNFVLDKYLGSKQKAKFNLYVADYTWELALQIFVANEISESNYTVNLMEDGTGTYSSFQNTSTGFGSEAGHTNFAAAKTAVNSKINTAKTNKQYPITGIGADAVNFVNAFAYATKPNVKYWLQYPEFLITASEDMKDILADEINTKKSDMTTMYESLSAAAQTKLKNAVFGNAAYMNGAINPGNDKKTLVLCGTSYNGEQGFSFNQGNGEKSKFEVVMNQIIEDYGNDYNIVLKPHPSWAIADEANGIAAGASWTSGISGNSSYTPAITQQAYLDRVAYIKWVNENKTVFKVLPGQVPMEMIMWAYADNIKVGGYNSSLFMNAKNDLIEFFILSSNSVNALSTPVPALLNGGFLTSEIKIYYPNAGAVATGTHTFAEYPAV